MIGRIRQWLWNRRREREIREEAERKAYNRYFDLALGSVLLREAQNTAAGRCNICGEQYVGMALDCKCTNWGKVG